MRFDPSCAGITRLQHPSTRLRLRNGFSLTYSTCEKQSESLVKSSARIISSLLCLGCAYLNTAVALRTTTVALGKRAFALLYGRAWKKGRSSLILHFLCRLLCVVIEKIRTCHRSSEAFDFFLKFFGRSYTVLDSLLLTSFGSLWQLLAASQTWASFDNPCTSYIWLRYLPTWSFIMDVKTPNLFRVPTDHALSPFSNL